MVSKQRLNINLTQFPPRSVSPPIITFSSLKYIWFELGAVVVKDRDDAEGKKLAQHIYFHQNAEGTALAPFDCWLVARGMKTMALRVRAQQDNAIKVAEWLATIPAITQVCAALRLISYDGDAALWWWVY